MAIAPLDEFPAPAGAVSVPVGEAVTRLHEAIDAARVADFEGADRASELRDLVTRIGAAEDKLAALRLTVVRLAQKHEVERSSGAPDTTTWLAGATASGSKQAADDVFLAEAVETSAHATGAAMTEGKLPANKALIITRALDRLPEWASREDRTTVEKALVEQAPTLDPNRLRKTARRALAEIETDPVVVDEHEDGQVADEESRALDLSTFSIHDNADGTMSGRFTVPVFAGMILKKAIDTMTSPRRLHGAPIPATPRERAHHRGRAFTDLLEHLPTDHLHGKVAATIVVTTELETLRGACRAAGTDVDEKVSAGELRRLACGAGLVPAVLDGASIPLDLGRQKRLFTEAQKVALAQQHTECAAFGCHRPYAWTELHHLRPWAQGGPTDLDNAIPLCGYHHRRIHAVDHQHRVLDRRGRPPIVRIWPRE